MMGGPSRRTLLKSLLAAAIAGSPVATMADDTPGPDLVEPGMRLKTRKFSPVTVALTFDACPGGFDARVAEALVANDAPATIFATGAWLRENPEGAAFLTAHPDIFAVENHG